MQKFVVPQMSQAQPSYEFCRHLTKHPKWRPSAIKGERESGEGFENGHLTSMAVNVVSASAVGSTVGVGIEKGDDNTLDSALGFGKETQH